MAAVRHAEPSGAWEHVRELAGGIGPRPATSPSERRAHEYAAEVLRGLGLDVAVEAFRSQSTFTWPWLLVATLAITAGVLAWFPELRWFGAVTGSVAAALYIGMADVAVDVGRLFAVRASQNVLARLSPAGGAQVRVVLAAHADSTRAALLFHPAQARHFGTNMRINLVATFWIGLIALLSALIPAAAPWHWIALPGVLPVAYGALLLIHREVAMPWVQGANDNASGVGVALALAAHFSRHRPRRTEIWFVITGCEEVGAPVGMSRFIQRHRAELGDARILVIDNVGAGDLRYLEGEGNLWMHRSDPELLRLAAWVAARHPEWRVGPSRVPAGSYTDAHPALAAGLPTLAVWAERDGVLPNWHWPTDVLARVEPETLERAFYFMRELVELIDTRTAGAMTP